MFKQDDENDSLKRDAVRVVVLGALSALAVGLSELGVYELGSWIRRTRKQRKKGEKKDETV